MKKLLSILLCCALLLSTAACGIFKKTITAQYAEIITRYEEEYGAISRERNIFYVSDALGGLSYIDLIDFNADGSDELVLIFDRATLDNDLQGALTCDIYADIDGTATLVYESELTNADIGTTVANTIGCELTGRTLPLFKNENGIGILAIRKYTQEMDSYPLEIYDSTKSDTVKTTEHTFLEYKYLSFDGKEFSADTVIATEKGAPSSNLFLSNGKVCSEQTFNDGKKEITRYIECSSYFYDDNLEQINKIKDLLELGKTDTAGYTPNIVKPSLSQDEVSKKYSEIISEYEKKYGTTTPIVTVDDESERKALDGVAYLDLIDFNKDGTDELLIVYCVPNKSQGYYSTEDYSMECAIFAAQGTEVVNVAKFDLPADEYRALNGKTLRLTDIGTKTYLYTCINYTLYMPDKGENDFMNVDSKFHQWFTADCYYEYNGEKLVLKEKISWQGERNDSLYMLNDEIIAAGEFPPQMQTLEECTEGIELIQSNYAEISSHNTNIKKDLNN